MVAFQLLFSDIAMLLAVGAISLLVLFEVTSPYLGLTNFNMNRKKLKTAALVLGFLFLIVFILATFNILSGL